ncbi:MAG: cytochrome c-type biogenesis protein [bacterium]
MPPRHLLPILIFFVVGITQSFAANPDEMLDDPILEHRAREISKELRCVVCQNQSIDDSNAPLARDMRILVRERLLEGDSNEEVKAYLVDRYGTFVLLKPPVQANTWILWFSPIVILLLTLVGYIYILRKRKDKITGVAPEALSDEERHQINEIQNSHIHSTTQNKTDTPSTASAPPHED